MNHRKMPMCHEFWVYLRGRIRPVLHKDCKCIFKFMLHKIALFWGLRSYSIRYKTESSILRTRNSSWSPINIISLSIFTDLLALGAELGRHTTGRIAWGINKTKTSGSFFEGFFIIKGQSHWDPHQDYCWCDAPVNVISKNKKKQKWTDLIITLNIWWIEMT